MLLGAPLDHERLVPGPLAPLSSTNALATPTDYCLGWHGLATVHLVYRHPLILPPDGTCDSPSSFLPLFGVTRANPTANWTTSGRRCFPSRRAA